MISLKVSILCGFLLLNAQNYTKNWEGSDLPGHSFAKFEDFNGKQDFKIKLDKNESFIFNYTVTVKKGDLHLEVKSPGGTVLTKDFKGTDSGELKILNPKGQKYKFIFSARHAEGNFDIKYKKI